MRSLGFLSGAGPPLSFASISLARTEISSSILYRGEEQSSCTRLSRGLKNKIKN